MKTKNWLVVVLAAAFLTGVCFAQTPEASKYYKLDFTVREMEGTKVVNTRSYSMAVTTETNQGSSIRAGSKVAVPSAPGSSQVQFIDVGVNIDCRSIKETQGQLLLTVTADLSTLQESATPAYPVVRQNRWGSTVVVPIKKPTVIFSSDDLTTKRQIQLELTATPIR